MQVITAVSMHDELNDWGAWAARCSARSEVGFYKLQPFAKTALGRMLDTEESRLIQIDGAVSRLFGSDIQLSSVLVYYYQHGYSFRQLATLLNQVSKQEPRFELPNGKNWNVNYLKQLVDVSVAKLEGYLLCAKDAA